MTEQYNYGGKSFQVNQPQGPTISGDGNQVTVTYHGSPQIPQQGVKERTERPESEKSLIKAVEAEVMDRLNQSLHNRVFIHLGKTQQYKQVKRPYDRQIRLRAKADEKLPADVTIQDVFDRPDIQGRLLILGQPGSGKTTEMLDLAKHLLERTEEPQAPIPVLFNLSSWASKQQSIREWMVAELKDKYGVRADIGQNWLEQQRLLPLLDGLDEVRSDLQNDCVKALNAWITVDAGYSNPVVVCSRIEEYEQLETQLQMNGAICLSELSDDQITDYFESVERSSLDVVVRQNPTLKELVRAPLFLSLIVIADQSAPGELEALQDTDEVQTRIFDLYISEMLALSQHYTRQQMRAWLVWIAQQLEREQQTEFLVEKIQPTWLQDKKLDLFYRLIVGLFSGNIVGLFFGTIIGLIYELIDGLIIGLIGGLIVGVIIELGLDEDEIEPVELLYWSWSMAIRNLPFGFIPGSIFGLIFGLNFGLFSVMFYGLFYGLIFGLFYGLIGGIKTSEVEQKIYVNQGIWNSLKLVNPEFLIFGLISGLIFGLIFGVHFGFIFALIGGLVFGLIGGLIAGLSGSGRAQALKHCVLRLIIFKAGFAPWNYAKFLTDCSDCCLLQRIGGRFRFIHKTVQEHFAAMPFDRSKTMR